MSRPIACNQARIRTVQQCGHYFRDDFAFGYVPKDATIHPSRARNIPYDINKKRLPATSQCASLSFSFFISHVTLELVGHYSRQRPSGNQLTVRS